MSKDDCQPPDFPAAHSMDSDWFAVDKDGFVAMLTTNEEGAMPMKQEQGDGSEQLNEIASALGCTLAEDNYGSGQPESVGLYSFHWNLDDGPYDVAEDPSLGQDEGDGPVMPYKRMAIPEKPIHISELPANIQRNLGKYVFKNIAFKDCEWVQPALYIPCQFWTSKDFSDVELVTETGKIVKNPTNLK